MGTLISSEGNIGQFFGRLNGGNSVFAANNCYLDGEINGTASGASASGATPIKVTAEQFASGEVCYLLNGDQSTIGWYQTLGADERPVLDATHAQVYMNGRLHCNGDVYEGSAFSNENTGVVQDEHYIMDGFCSYCGLYDPDYMTPNADGFYEVSNAKQLVWFEKKVNGGELGANAILTNDIDFEPLLAIWKWSSIGASEAKAFTGTFDGQGHKITGFKLETAVSAGLFGCVTNATIQNFSVAGTITATGGTGTGLVGWPSKSTIRNIHSTVDIAVPVSGVHHVGGVVGSARGGNVIEGCSFSGTMTVAAGSTDNFAGVVAYLGGDSVANCANYGTITFSDAGCAGGGVAGYLNNTTSYVRNCLNIGKVFCDVSDTPKYGGAIIGRIKNNWSNTRVVNNYWLEDSAYGPSRKDDGTSPLTASEEGTPASDLASGEITWKLNEEEFMDVAWYQTLGEDEYPVLDNTAALVYETPTGYACISPDDPGSFEPFRDGIVANETEFIEDDELVAYQALIDGYKAALEVLANTENQDDFFTTYRAVAELKDKIKQSAAKYAEYVKACEAAANYLTENNLEGEWSDFLKTYLETSVEPGKDYPNGSSVYIMENLNLSDDALSAEIDFVSQMLENAIAGGLTSGTEVTRLLTNSNFTDSFEGWFTDAADGATFSTGGVAEIMKIARGKEGSFDIQQTIYDVPNGIYMMTLNGMFLAGGDNNSTYYAGQLYLNGTGNYFMSPSEDLISNSEAVDKENCYIENDAYILTENGDEGYVPTSFVGCSYAYGAGRYLNFCAGEVTDGSLSVGMRSLGTGIAGDWLPFGNLHVYYLGTPEEANEKLADVLEGFAERAQVILDFVPSDGYDGIEEYPNISEVLKLQLTEAIAAVENAATGEQKMSLINTFSDLFLQVHACRKAYTAMLVACNPAADIIENLVDNGFITEDEYYEWRDFIDATVDHFIAGDVTTDEALAIADKLNIMDKLLPSEDGVYQIADATQLQLFGMLVNSGNGGVKGALTSDIDMSEVEFFTPLGSPSSPFTGEFDGQGHAITNFVYEAIGDNNGLFGYVNNAKVKNFSISGTLTSDGYTYNGVVGQAEGSSVISGIHSSMDINVSNKNAHSGGIVGGMTTASKMLVLNCEYSGTLTHSGTGDCQAGIVGYTYAGGIKNCIFSGTIIGQSSKYGGILGYCKVPGFQGVQNCLSIGKIIANEGCTTAAAIIANWNGDKTEKVTNNYYRLQEGSTTDIAIGNKASSCEAPHYVSEEQLASGEVCFKLNGDQEVPAWYQTLGEDANPVLDNTHQTVLYDETNGYYNGSDDEDGLVNEELRVKNEESSTAIYNLAGQRISKLQKGINIVGGKKVLY